MSRIRFAVAIAAFGCVATSAAAQNVPVWNWSGFYAGGHIGYGHGQTRITDPATPGVALTTTVKGFLGGGQLGYNAQFGHWVLGLEADFSGTGVDGTTVVRDNTGDFSSSNPKVRWTSLATGRLGYAFDRSLIYMKGGAAFAGFKYNAADLTNGTSGSASFSRTGWTVGGGLEYGLNRNWSVLLQYDYLHFGSKTFSVRDNTGAVARVGLGQRLHQIKVGINYRFGG
jgi:outer membrane immunogenic protein